MRSLLLAFLLCPVPALAQDGDFSVAADLDGDGAPETFSLVPGDESSVALRVETAEGGFTLPDAAWQGGLAGQEASLALSPGGSVLLGSGNDAVGRDRWALTVTIAFREGELRVAGLTYEWRDTLDPEAGGTCDLNLLTGRGTLTDAAGTRAVEAPAALLLRDWREDGMALPDGCRG